MTTTQDHTFSPTTTGNITQVPFFQPHDGKGKWHAKRRVSGTADCGAPVILGDERIHATKDALTRKKFHPIICGRCARLHRDGYSSVNVIT